MLPFREVGRLGGRRDVLRSSLSLSLSLSSSSSSFSSAEAPSVAGSEMGSVSLLLGIGVFWRYRGVLGDGLADLLFFLDRGLDPEVWDPASSVYSLADVSL